MTESMQGGRYYARFIHGSKNIFIKPLKNYQMAIRLLSFVRIMTSRDLLLCLDVIRNSKGLRKMPRVCYENLDSVDLSSLIQNILMWLLNHAMLLTNTIEVLES